MMMALGLFFGAVTCTAVSYRLIDIVAFGSWGAEHQPQQLAILGWALAGFEAGILLVLTAMAVGGPLGRLKLSAGREGLNIEADQDREADDANA